MSDFRSTVLGEYYLKNKNHALLLFVVVSHKNLRNIPSITRHRPNKIIYIYIYKATRIKNNIHEFQVLHYLYFEKHAHCTVITTVRTYRTVLIERRQYLEIRIFHEIILHHSKSSFYFSNI